MSERQGIMMRRYCFKFVTFCVCVYVPLVACAASITLKWDPVTTDVDGAPISNLAGYYLFQSTSSLLGKTTQQAMVDPSISKVTILSPATSTVASVSYSVTDLKEGATYFFRLTAYDTSGSQSEFNVGDSGADEEISVFIPVLLVPAPSSPAKIPAQVRHESSFDLDTKYLHGDLMLIKVKVEEGSAPILKVKLRYSGTVAALSSLPLTYSMDMVKVSNQVYAGYVDTRKLSETGIVSYQVEVVDAAGDIVTTSQGWIKLDSNVAVKPKLPGIFEVSDGNPADGEIGVNIPLQEQVNQVEFKRLSPEQFLSKGEKDINHMFGNKPVTVYDVSVPGQASTIFSVPASLTLVYSDLDGADINSDSMPDGDGYVDGTNIPEQNLRLFWHDGLNWRLIGGEVDSVKNTVVAKVEHFSVYGLFPVAQTVSSVKAQEKFLSPTIQDGINDVALFGLEAQEVTIFNVNSRQVFQASQTQGVAITWNCRDDSGNIVESGVYIARIKQQDGNMVYQCFAVVK